MDDRNWSWIPEAIRTIEGNSDHSAIQIKLVHKGVVVGCSACGKAWTLLIDSINVLIIGYPGETSPIQAGLVTFLAQIMESECWGLPRLQLLAEYLTQRLEAAGEKGVPWDLLIREIVVNNKAPGGDVERTVRSIGFEEVMVYFEHGGSGGTEFRPGIRLPHSHPLRNW